MQFFGGNASAPFNPIATQLFNHEHLSIRGSVFINTIVEERYRMRAWGRYAEVTDAISNLGLSAPPTIFDVGIVVPQVDIYAATQNDLLAIRMCL